MEIEKVGSDGSMKGRFIKSSKTNDQDLFKELGIERC